MKPSSLSFVILLHFEVRNALSFFESLPGDTDVFRNPKCGSDKSGKDSSSCDCAEFNALCVYSGCGECKCRRKTRIYRSDVRKCLSDLEARDPWCRYQFFNIKPDVIPTIDLSRPCAKNKCSQPINAPLDKTKHVCRVSWVHYLENGTWRENPVRKFQETFDLRGSDYFPEQGYMYRIEWKTSRESPIPKRLFQVSLECVDRDSMKESYCLMFRVRGKEEQAVVPISESSFNVNALDTKKPTHSIKPTKHARRRVNTLTANIVVVNDNFPIILAAVAGAVGTAIVIIPLALFYRRTMTKQQLRRDVSATCEQQGESVGQEVDVEPETSEETLSSYTSLKRYPERDEPPSIYQSLSKASRSELPSTEVTYITVLGDEEEPVKIPPIYHVLDELDTEVNSDELV